MQRPGVVTRPVVGQVLRLSLAVAWRAGDQRAIVRKFVQWCQSAASALAETGALGRQPLSTSPVPERLDDV
jgi:hypothetical protein